MWRYGAIGSCLVGMGSSLPLARFPPIDAAHVCATPHVDRIDCQSRESSWLAPLTKGSIGVLLPQFNDGCPIERQDRYWTAAAGPGPLVTLMFGGRMLPPDGPQSV